MQGLCYQAPLRPSTLQARPWIRRAPEMPCLQPSLRKRIKVAKLRGTHKQYRRRRSLSHGERKGVSSPRTTRVPYNMQPRPYSRTRSQTWRTSGTTAVGVENRAANDLTDATPHAFVLLATLEELERGLIREYRQTCRASRNPIAVSAIWSAGSSRISGTSNRKVPSS